MGVFNWLRGLFGSDPQWDAPPPPGLTPRKRYQYLLYAKAKKQGWTADQVRELDYHAVGAICGVDTSEGHAPNFDFFPHNVSAFVANTLAAEEKAEVAEGLRLDFLEKIRLRSTHREAEVYDLGDGTYRVVRDPSKFEVVG